MKITKSQLKQIIMEELTSGDNPWVRQRLGQPDPQEEESEQTNDDVEVLVQGYGRLLVSQIKTKIARDLSDMSQKAAAGNFRAIGISRLNIVSVFLKALMDFMDYEEE